MGGAIISELGGGIIPLRGAASSRNWGAASSGISTGGKACDVGAAAVAGWPRRDDEKDDDEMTKTYRVTATREIKQSHDLEIEAEDEFEARDLAEDEIIAESEGRKRPASRRSGV